MLKIVVQSPRYAAMVKLPNGMSLTKEKALASGYVVAKDEADAAEIRAKAGELSGAGTSYLDALLALPEAKERPLATACIAAQHTPKTMSLAKAGLFLSGLPIETVSDDDRPLKLYSAAADALLKRKVELHLYTLNTRAIRGDREAKADATKIAYGLEFHRSSNLQCAHALKAAGVDLERLGTQLEYLRT